MRVRSHWLLALIAVAATVLASCSKHHPLTTAPESEQRVAGRAPLLAKPAGANTIPDAYVVVFNNSVPDVPGEVARIAQQHNIQATHVYQHAIKGFAATIPPAAVEALRDNPNVRYIEQDQIAHADATQPNPTWGLDRIDQRNLPLSNSYTYDFTGTGIKAYILDTGIRFTHTEFGGRAVSGFDAIDGGTADDGNGHGTHVSGTVGGTTYGVAKNVSLVAVRVLDNSGSGSFAQVISGVDWVTGDHTTTPSVANMSLSGSVFTALDDAVRASIADGVTYCVSAGNNAADASTRSPAGVIEAITVGATSITDGWASFSNFGPVVDISGPGVSITSSWFTSDVATNTISGTSMSSPHVAGVAALYLSANPSASPAAVQSAIVSNATTGVITGIPPNTANRLLYSLFGPPPPDIPAPPVLVSPADGARNVSRSPTLTWNASSGATSYRVQVSTDPSFSTLVFDQAGITGTSVSLSGLAGRTVHYWHVNATGSGGTSAYSATFSFRTRRN